jgi:transposase
MGSMRKSRLSQHKQDRLQEHFVAGTTAGTAFLVGVNFKTMAYYLHRLRETIAHNLDQEADAVFSGEIKANESYFGSKRKGKRGRGAVGKVPVFGFLKREGKVYTKVIPDASSATLSHH